MNEDFGLKHEILPDSLLLSRVRFGANALFAAQVSSPARLKPKDDLGQRDLATHLGLAALFAGALHQLALAMAQLFRQTLSHNFDGLIKIVSVIFGMQVRPSQGEMDFDHKSMLRRLRTVMPQRHMRPDQIQPEVLQTLDFLSNMRMNGRSELNISRTDVNLHTSSYIRVKPMSNSETIRF